MAEKTQSGTAATEPRKSMPSPRLGEAEFKQRYRKVTNAALALAEAVEKRRAGEFPAIGAGLEDPRPK